jgi:outer membrane protein OmpA-like peptidoglycan-associated protein
MPSPFFLALLLLAAAPPPAAAAPAPPQAFIIFFDFDSAEINAQAAAVLANVLAAQRAGAAPRITVEGHADRAHSDADSEAISRVRAWAVYDHLVVAGVPGATIAVHYYGEARPLVETGDGVREPQNRRVEIRFSPAEDAPPR